MNLEPIAKKRLLFLAIALLVLASIAAGIYGYRRYAVHRELAALKAQGIAASVAGDHARAIDELARYLGRRADDPEAMRYYARSRLAASPPNDPQAAAEVISVLQAMSQLGPLTSDEHRRLMELYGFMQNDSGVTREADRLLGSSPNDPQALKSKSMALLRQRDWPAALASARSWSQAAPLDIEAQSCYLSAMLQAGTSPTEVIAQAVRLRRAHPDDPRFELLESLVLTQTGQPAETADSAPRGTAPDPRSAADWARTAAARKQPDVRCAHLLVDQLDRLALFDESLGLLRRQIAANGDPACRQALGRRLWVSGQWADLAQLLHDSTTSDATADAESLCLDGVAMSRLGRADDAARARSQLQHRDDPRAKAWHSVLKQLTGQADGTARQLAEGYANGLARDSDNPFFHYFLADALTRVGENDLAIEQLRIAAAPLATWAAPDARLSELLLQQGRSEAALLAAVQAQFRETHAGPARDLSITFALGRAWLACLMAGRSNDEAGLAKLVAAVQQLAPRDDRTLALQVGLLVRGNDRAAATKILQQALDDPQPLSQAAALSYANISRSAGLNLETECFDRCQRDHGMTADLAYARAARLLSVGEADKGLALLDSSRDARSAVTHDDQAWKLARARYLDAAANPGARAAWVAIGDENPEDLSLQLQALSARSAHADRQFVDRTIERAHKLTGDGAVVWRLARARWLLEGSAAAGVSRADAESAARTLSAVIRTCPECIDARLLMASCQQKLQNLDGAIEQFQVASRLLPDSVDLAMQLIRLLEERGDFAQAQQILRPFTNGPLANPVALVATGWLQERDGDLDGAERSYRQALALRKDMLAAENNLAMILVKKGNAGDLQEALSLANAATKANPGSAALLDTLSAAQAKNRDYVAALASITKAIAIAGPNANFKLRQVELLVQAGQKDAARTAFAELQSLLSNAPSDKNNDLDLTDRVRKMQDALAIAPETRILTKSGK